MRRRPVSDSCLLALCVMCDPRIQVMKLMGYLTSSMSGLAAKCPSTQAPIHPASERALRLRKPSAGCPLRFQVLVASGVLFSNSLIYFSLACGLETFRPFGASWSARREASI